MSNKPLVRLPVIKGAQYHKAMKDALERDVQANPSYWARHLMSGGFPKFDPARPAAFIEAAFECLIDQRVPELPLGPFILDLGNNGAFVVSTTDCCCIGYLRDLDVYRPRD